jgi:hypothetical protein
MVTCDIIGFRRTFTNRVKDRVKDKFGRFVVRGFHRDHDPLQRSDRPRLIREASRVDRRQRGPRCGQESSSEVMEAGVRRVEGVGLHSDQRGAPDVPPSHPGSKPAIIAVSALLELVEWLELRRKSRQGGCPCNAVPSPLSPPVSTRSESSASGSGGTPLVQSARAESPGRVPNPAPTPAPKTSRRRRAGGRS